MPNLRLVWIAAPLAAFVLGVLITPGIGTSYVGPYKAIFGHSTSCAGGVASINDASAKAGARTSNFRGCSSTNPTRSVPPYYLGARAVMGDSNTGAICGWSSLRWNTTTTWTVVVTQSWTNGTGCSKPGYYIGQNEAYRSTDSGELWRRADIFSPKVYLSIWDT